MDSMAAVLYLHYIYITCISVWHTPNCFPSCQIMVLTVPSWTAYQTSCELSSSKPLWMPFSPILHLQRPASHMVMPFTGSYAVLDLCQWPLFINGNLSDHFVDDSTIWRIIAVDIKSFLFSNGLISDHQIWIHIRSLQLGHAASTLPTMDGDPQYQTWDQGCLSGHTVSQAFDAISHPALLSRLCIQKKKNIGAIPLGTHLDKKIREPLVGMDDPQNI